MKSKQAIITTAISGLLALGIGTLSGTAFASENEECFGISKAGKNGCNSNSNKHSCAGHSKIDNDPDDFAFVPAGSCLKIGGKLEPAGNKPASSDKK